MSSSLQITKPESSAWAGFGILGFTSSLVIFLTVALTYMPDEVHSGSILYRSFGLAMGAQGLLAGIMFGLGVFKWRRERDLLYQVIQSHGLASFVRQYEKRLNETALDIDKIYRELIEEQRINLCSVHQPFGKGPDQVDPGKSMLEKSFKQAVDRWYLRYDRAVIFNTLPYVQELIALKKRSWKEYTANKIMAPKPVEP